MKKKIQIDLEKTDEVLEREAKKFGGNASHVILPAKHRGKDVTIITSEKKDKEKEDDTQTKS